MEKQFIIDNNRERERLTKLVERITDEELNLVIFKEGWTIAVAFTHLAFLDQYILALLKRWKRDGVSLSHHEWNDINYALLPLALAIPPREAAQLAISSADAVDQYIEQLTPEFIGAVEKLNKPYAL